MKKINVSVGVAFLVGSVAVAAQMQDYDGGLKLARSLGNADARYERCGVNTSGTLDRIKAVASACNATASERSNLINAFTLAKTQSRIQVSGLACDQTHAVAQANYQSTMEALEAQLEGAPQC